MVTETPVTLVLAEEGDIPAVVTLMNQAFRGRGAEAGWNSEADYIDGDRTTDMLFREDLDKHPGGLLLVVRDPVSTSLIGAVRLDPVSALVWRLGSLAVRPSQQNTGLGRRVLSLAEEEVLRRGGEVIEMRVVNVRETLIAWYLRRGYEDAGRTDPFPYGDARFGVPRRNDLSFTVLRKTLIGAAVGELPREKP